MSKTLVIAEAGVNHNGSLKLAYELVDQAKLAGADIVKFQTFVTEELVTKDAEQAQYQAKNIGETSTQYEMLKKLELSFEEHKLLQRYCQENSITYLSTAFDLKSLAFLVDELKLSTLKIPSGEITNAPYLLAHAQTKKPLILSTGMANINEIEDALAVIAFGLLSANMPTSLEDCYQIYGTEEGQIALQRNVTLLHCTTEYPTPLSDVNLLAMKTMADHFSLPVGYSDHTAGILVPSLAVANGASVVEKHFTLSKEMPGPDHKASLEPAELKAMIEQIRETELALGNPTKQACQSEKNNKQVVRKSIVASIDIREGEDFSLDNIAIKRPALGRSPMRYWQTLGQKSPRSYKKGDCIEE